METLTPRAQSAESTNPTPRLTSPSRKKLLWTALAVVVLLAAAFGCYRLFFPEEERVAVTGSTTYGSLSEAIEGSGTTTPADSVTYDVNGTVLEWHVEAGQEVQEGDLLYVLDSSEARDEILEHEVELEELYEQLADIQENIANQQVTAPFSGRVEEITALRGRSVQSGAALCTLVDDTVMKATFYFGYSCQEQIAVGMPVTLSFPDLMLTREGRVCEIHYVDYVTAEGLRCFAVTVETENPGSLTEGTAASCWIASEAGELYAVGDAALEYRSVDTVTAGASGELSEIAVVDYQRVEAGELLFVIDASGYESQLDTVQKQIENYEENIADLEEAIATEYTRYADIAGQVVAADYMTNRMTGTDMGSVVIYNQQTMQITVNIDELDADALTEGMEVTVYRTTSSEPVFYPATLTYLSLEATSGSSGVSTFEAEITIDSRGELSSGVTVYYSIDTRGGETAGETVLAPLNALCRYDDGYYLLVKAEEPPAEAIQPAEVGGSVTDYPEGYYAVPVEVGSFNGSVIQILSGAEEGSELFLRYQNAAPAGGDSTSDVGEEDTQSGRMPSGGFSGQMPSGFPGNMGGQGGMAGGFGGQMPGGRN